MPSMINWMQGYSSEWRIFKVNRRTWADESTLANASSISIERDASGELLESGSFEVDGGDFEEGYYRIVMTATQGAVRERVDVATLLCSTSTGEVNRRNNRMEIVGESVLKPASDMLLLKGEYVWKGTDGAQAAAQLLARAIQAPISVTGSFTLDDTFVFDLGTTILGAAWAILDAGGFCIQLEGNGTVNILPLPSEPTLILDNAGARLLQPGIDYEYDWTDIPNRYTAIDGASGVTAINDSAASPTSTVSRGRYIDVVDESPTKVNGETLEAYALRKLQELSTIKEEHSYVREYQPDIYPYAIVRGSIESAGIEGDLRISNQSLECGAGITVTEKAVREISTWQ